MQEAQLLYLLMTLSMARPADVPHRPPPPQTTQHSAGAPLHQSASARLISQRCPQPCGGKTELNLSSARPPALHQTVVVSE